MRFFCTFVWLIYASQVLAHANTFSDNMPFMLQSASELDYPPLAVVTSQGKADGFSVELLRAAVHAMGHDVQFKVGQWHDIKQQLVENKLDVLPLVGRTLEREKLFDFTIPYFSLHGTAVVRKGDTRIQNLADIQGKTVVVMRGDNAEEYVQRTNVTDAIVTTDSYAQAFKALAQGQHDVMIVNHLVALHFIRQLQLQNVLEVVPHLDLFRQDFSFAVHEGNKTLLALLNEGLALIMSDGTALQLEQKWLSNHQARHSINYLSVILFSVLGSAFIIGGLAWLWQRSLQRRVERRTAELRAVQAQLQAREEQLLILINATPDIICFKDAQGRWLEANDADLTLFQLQNIDYHGKTDSELAAYTAPLYRDAFQACEFSDEMAWRNAKATRSEEVIPLLTGGERVYDLIKIPLFHTNGARKGLVVQGRDITERKRMEERLSLWGHVFEQADWGIVLCKGGSRCFEQVNPAFAYEHGYRVEEMQGMDITTIFPPTFHNTAFESIQQAEHLGHYCYEAEHVRKNGSCFPVWVEITAVKDEQGVVVYRVGNVQNISERKKTEASLRQANQELAKENLYRRKNAVRINALDRLSQQMHTMTEREICAQALDVVVALTDSHVGYLHLVHEDQENIQLMMWNEATQQHCSVPDDFYNSHYPLSKAGIWADSMRQKQVVIHNDYAHTPDKKGLPTGHVPITRHMSAPVIDGALVRMVIGVGNKESDYSEEDAQQLQVTVDAIQNLVMRHRSEHALHVYSERLALATETAGIGIWEWNVQKQKLIWDEQMFQVFQIDPSTFKGELDDWRRTIAFPQDLAEAETILQEAVLGIQPMFSCQFRIRVPDGSIHHIQADGKVHRDAQGKTIRVIGTNWDITEQETLLEKLACSERRFRALIESSPASIYETDTKGHYLLVNPRWCEMAGMSEEAALGKGWSKGLHPEDRDKLFASWQHMVESHGRFALEYRFQNQQGEITWVSGTAAPIYDAQGQITGYIGINTDITSQKHKEREILRYQQQLNDTQKLSRIGGWTYEPATQTLLWSDEIFHLHGLNIDRKSKTAQHYIERSMSCYEVQDREQVIAEFQRAVEQGVPYDSVYRFTNYQQQHMWVRTIGNPVIEDDKVVLIQGAFMDITAQKEWENQLRYTKEQAEMANRAKSAFIANMSHELRTPLNAVLGYAQLLLNNSNLTSDQQQSINAIKRSGDYLLLLINDVLDLAKIEAGRFELVNSACDLSMFFAGLCELFDMRAQQKGIAFHCQNAEAMPTVIEIDEKRLRQICMNLLSNAVKFTEKGAVRLETDYRDGQLHVAVSDTGIGISEERMSSLFQPFVQVGDERYKQQGTGLGLAISQNLVQQMGGTIHVNSHEGAGSCFSIAIPAPVLVSAQPDTTQSTTKQLIGYQRQDGSTQALRILIVDDETVNRLLLHELLDGVGFDVEEVSSGEAAVQKSTTTTIDLILMDLAMSGINGLEASQQILTQKPNLPIIMLSACAFAEDRENSLAAGCRAHLAKPIKVNELWGALQDYLPLQWRYAVPVENTPATFLSTTAIATQLHQLPSGMRDNLTNAILLGSSSAIQQALSEIHTVDRILAEALQKRLDAYEYEAVLDLLGGEYENAFKLNPNGV